MTNKIRIGIFDSGNGGSEGIRARLDGDVRFEAVALKTEAGAFAPEDGGTTPELLVVFVGPENPDIGDIIFRQVEEKLQSMESTRVTQALSDREKQVLALHRQGLSREQVGERLGISYFTVRRHIQNALDKTGMSSVKSLLEMVGNAFAVPDGVSVA